MTHLPLPPPHHLKHTLGLGTKPTAPHSPVSSPSTPPPYPGPILRRNLVHPPLPITSRTATLPIFFYLYKKKKSFKYNLRIPPSTGVCLWFPPPPHPRPPHSLMDTAWGSVGAGRCLGVVAGPRHYSGNRHDNESVSPRGKGGNNKTGPPHPNTDSYDKDRRKTKQGTTTKNGCGGGEEEK